jgi:dynein heavy chain
MKRHLRLELTRSGKRSKKIKLINFMITQNGLDDQSLGIVTSKEKPELKQVKNELIVQ